MAILTKLAYIFNAIFIKIPLLHLQVWKEKNHLRVPIEPQKTTNIQSNSEE